jgi:IS1 family transposase
VSYFEFWALLVVACLCILCIVPLAPAKSFLKSVIHENKSGLVGLISRVSVIREGVFVEHPAIDVKVFGRVFQYSALQGSGGVRPASPNIKSVTFNEEGLDWREHRGNEIFWRGKPAWMQSHIIIPAEKHGRSISVVGGTDFIRNASALGLSFTKDFYRHHEPGPLNIDHSFSSETGRGSLPNGGPRNDERKGRKNQIDLDTEPGNSFGFACGCAVFCLAFITALVIVYVIDNNRVFFRPLLGLCIFLMIAGMVFSLWLQWRDLRQEERDDKSQTFQHMGTLGAFGAEINPVRTVRPAIVADTSVPLEVKRSLATFLFKDIVVGDQSGHSEELLSRFHRFPIHPGNHSQPSKRGNSQPDRVFGIRIPNNLRDFERVYSQRRERLFFRVGYSQAARCLHVERFRGAVVNEIDSDCHKQECFTFPVNSFATIRHRYTWREDNGESSPFSINHISGLSRRMVALFNDGKQGEEYGPRSRSVGPSEKAVPTWRVPFGFGYVLWGLFLVRVSRGDRITKQCGFLCGIIGVMFILHGYVDCQPDNDGEDGQIFQHNRENVPQNVLTLPYFLEYSKYIEDWSMANVLSTDKKIAVIGALAEGSSIRSIERMTGIHRDTIMKLGVKVGQGCTSLMDAKMRNLPCRRLEMDEIWGFVGKKERHVRMDDRAGVGSVWTFCAIDAETKLVPAFKCGDRTQATASAFVADVASRMAYRVQISTDGLGAYVGAIEDAFGGDVDYAQIIKVYGTEGGSDNRRYSPPEMVSIEKKVMVGNPNQDLISTSYVERLNATTRLHMRRLTRLTLAFSKKRENFEAAVGLHFGYYNFVKRHNTLRCTPAMAAGVTNTFWSIGDLVEAAA